MRTCLECATTFDPQYRQRRYCSRRCREQANQDKRRDSGRARADKLRAVFGLDVADYEAMVINQGSACAVCRRPETTLGNHGKVKRMAVDHNHDTGAVRGLLCQSCNMVLGLMDDTPERLRAAADYLERFV